MKMDGYINFYGRVSIFFFAKQSAKRLEAMRQVISINDCSYNMSNLNCTNINRKYIPDFLFGVLEALSHKVQRLELGDGIFLKTRLLRFKWVQLRLLRQAVLIDEAHVYFILQLNLLNLSTFF